MRPLRFVPSVCVASLLALAVACGSSSSDNTFGDPASSGGAGAGGDNGGFGPNDGTSGGASGGDGQECAATVAATEKPKVDIVFVIDDSGSMTEEMVQIKQNVNTFASKIGTYGLDYVVVFIVKRGTSGNTICVPPPLGGAACADNPPTFFHVNQDVQSNDSLSLILSTYDSKTAALAWNSHLRPEATKVFIEVTDDESDLKATDFDTQLLAKAPAGMFGTATARKYIFHSIISKPAGVAAPSSQKCPTAANTSLQYQALSTLTNGIMDEVCKTDYSGVLDNIAKGIVDKVGCELGYPTNDAADPTKLVVQYTPMGGAASTLTQVTDASKCASVPNAWYYDDPTKPTKIILCPSTCTTVDAVAGTKVEALVGCKAPAPS